MLRRGLTSCVTHTNLMLSNKSKQDKFFDKNIAYESDYYYRQDKELLELLRKKTQDEVRSMKNKVRSMQHKIEVYNRDIDETMRFLNNLDKDIELKNKKT
ncbi:uncharacterized protein LOC122854192 isoform X2 [Aphidius gifuensis]|uniref:uncharacterized protein LOC122854192 isoform X2 n=1 Tax=Aphidius gifuensis TaxID=684658 RepID=UPI001CDC2952|nr:uncharacterized protein LOC122854192 isoform X2 [Aphidius gifuensis]